MHFPHRCTPNLYPPSQNIRKGKELRLVTQSKTSFSWQVPCHWKVWFLWRIKALTSSKRTRVPILKWLPPHLGVTYYRPKSIQPQVKNLTAQPSHQVIPNQHSDLCDIHAPGNILRYLLKNLSAPWQGKNRYAAIRVILLKLIFAMFLPSFILCLVLHCHQEGL